MNLTSTNVSRRQVRQTRQKSWGVKGGSQDLTRGGEAKICFHLCKSA